jgi:competence protein ComEC
MNIFRKLPFLRVLICLAAGISVYNYAPVLIPDSVLLVLLLVSTATFITLYLRKSDSDYKRRWIPGLFSSIAIFLTGWLLTSLRMPAVLEESTTATVSARIMTLEYRNNDRIRMLVKPLNTSDSLVLKSRDLLMLIVSGLPGDTLHEGDIISFTGAIRPLPKPANPYAFDYGRYLRNKGVAGIAYLPSSDIILALKAKTSLRTIPAQVRAWSLRTLFRYGLSDQAAAIAQAMLFGDRSGIDRDLNDRFVKTGVVHILAVSGLHVGIIQLFINFMLIPFFRKSSSIRWLISSSALLGYSFITGFSPSVSRAAFMFSVVSAGKLSNRSSNIYNLICLSASALLVINPLTLFNVGFILSHAAVVGIAAFYKPINNLFSFRFIMWRQLWSLVAVSVSAQLTTLPISVYLFSAFPTWFVISNLTIVPLCTPIMLATIAVLLFSPLPFVARIFAGFANDLLIFMVDFTGAVEQLPGNYIENLWLSFPLMLVSYLAILGLYLVVTTPSFKNISVFLGLCVALIAGINVQNITKLDSCQLVVYSSSRGFVADIASNGNVFNIRTNDVDSASLAYTRNSYMKRKAIRPRKCDYLVLQASGESEIRFFNVGEHSFLLLSGTGSVDPKSALIPYYSWDPIVYPYPNSLKGNSDTSQLTAQDPAIEAPVRDITLIIAGRIIGNPEQIIDYFQCSEVVIGFNCSRYFRDKWQKAAQDRGIGFYVTYENGAYLKDCS